MDFSKIKIEDYNKYTFGKCIKQQREELGLSLRSVATSLNISPAYLSDIEKGYRYAPTKNEITGKLIQILNIPSEQEEYIYEMVAVTRGCYNDIKEYITDNYQARKFLRTAKDMNLSDEDWQALTEQLELIKNKKEKVI